MNTTLVERFNDFFEGFKDSWNSCNSEEMITRFSPDLKVSWGGLGSDKMDWNYEQACLGWKQAFDSYKGKNPKWHFDVMHVTPASENEVVTMYWLTFEQEGEYLPTTKLFIQRFRLDNDGEWRLIREFCENFNSNQVITERSKELVFS